MDKNFKNSSEDEMVEGDSQNSPVTVKYPNGYVYSGQLRDGRFYVAYTCKRLRSARLVAT